MPQEIRPTKPRVQILKKQFGRLKVESFSHRRGYKKYWRCKCDCGNQKVVMQTYLTTGQTKSCGCLGKENLRKIGRYHRTHGMTGTRFYRIWKGINGRCYVKSNKAFKHYGFLGITSAWHSSFNKFKNEMYESYLAHVDKFGESDTTIDRINPFGNYSKSNCRWATLLEQANNKRE